jgi:hypothetical protein
MLYPVLNSIGLVLDIFGVVLLFKFGLPEEIRRTGASFVIIEETDEAEVTRAMLYDRLGRLGLGLLILGFTFQLTANLLQLWWGAGPWPRQ